MIDRAPAPGLAGRVELTFEDDQSVRYAKMAMADGAPDGWTPLNKATLLDDETAAAIGDATTPNEAFQRLAPSIPGATNWDSGNFVLNHYTATPLNGWVSVFPPQYMPEISRVGNIVNITATLIAGVVTTGTVIISLPSWANPAKTKYMSVNNYDNTIGRILISSNSVTVNGGIAIGQTVFFDLTYGIL